MTDYGFGIRPVGQIYDRFANPVVNYDYDPLENPGTWKPLREQYANMADVVIPNEAQSARLPLGVDYIKAKNGQPSLKVWGLPEGVDFIMFFYDFDRNCLVLRFAGPGLPKCASMMTPYRFGSIEKMLAFRVLELAGLKAWGLDWS